GILRRTGANTYDVVTDYSTYWINSAGSSGQVWKSDGSGAGYWAADNDTGASESTIEGYIFDTDNSAGATRITGNANGLDILSLRRYTNTSPTGNFIDLENASGTSLFTVDINGNLTLTNNATIDGVDISDYSPYFIDSAGAAGQYWISDGSGAGTWVTVSEDDLEAMIFDDDAEDITGVWTITAGLEVADNIWLDFGATPDWGIRFDTANDRLAVETDGGWGGGDIYFDLADTSGNSTFTITNTNGTYQADLFVEGDISLTANSTVDGVDISDYSPYFIDSAGSSGQSWRSDGSGRGAWATPYAVYAP
ncbi:MAG: hypothetical protein JW871_09045, partial [Endomicrobiales bacterium]|nr:hypothetical protein [Endomicrobiales bacterium]